MSEPPIQVTAEGTEPHPRKVGHRLIDLAVAGAAITISLISLFVAVSHGRTMEKLVAANSWPLLIYDTSNVDRESQSSVITLSIDNVGVGPALVKSFTVFLDGKPVRSQGDLLRTCCPPPSRVVRSSAPAPNSQDIGPITSDVANAVIRPGEGRDYIRLSRSPAYADQWDALNQARSRLRFEACYCSVLGDCWEGDLRNVDARPVKNCPAIVPESTRKIPAGKGAPQAG